MWPSLMRAPLQSTQHSAKLRELICGDCLIVRSTVEVNLFDVLTEGGVIQSEAKINLFSDANAAVLKVLAFPR